MKARELREVRAFLRSRGSQGATGLEIHALSGTLNLATLMAELRRALISTPEEIPAARYEGRSRNGRKIYRYRIIRAGA